MSEKLQDELEPIPDTIEKKDTESSEESKTDLDNWNEWVDAANKAAEQEKVTEDSSVMFGEDNIKKNEIKDRAKKLQVMEEDAEWSKAKRKWKVENPDQNIKDWKQAYIVGRIHQLPWASYVQGSETADEEKDRIKPDLTTVIEPGYVQNEEQTDNSVWKKIRDKDNK